MRVSSPPSGGCANPEAETARSSLNPDSGAAGMAGTDTLEGSALNEFGFTGDPFRVDYVLPRPDLFTRQAGLTLSNLTRHVRLAAEAKSGLLLVGPEGSGRSLLLKSLAQNLDQNGEAGSIVYLDAGAGVRGVPQDWVKDGRLQPMGCQRGKSSTTLLIDNADRMFEGAQPTYDLFLKGRTISALVLGISYPTYFGIRENGSLSERFNSHLAVPAYEREEIARMLKATVQSCIAHGEPFESDAYEEIATQSMGLPGLATDLSRFSLLVAYWVGLPIITRTIVRRTAERLLYIKANDLVTGRLNFQGTRGAVLQEILRKHYIEGECPRNNIYESLNGLAGSTIDYHAQKLEEEGVLSIERRSHRVRYEVPADPRRLANHDVKGEAIAGRVWFQTPPCRRSAQN